MNEIIVNILLIIGGATGQYILSAFMIPKKEKRDADQEFIDVLIQRISNLEGRMDEQSKQLTNVMTENAMLKVELDYLKKENAILKKKMN
jgi:predicted nuclease with TOPRIM domain